MTKSEKLVLINDTEKFLELSLEPWGEDYTLRDKEVVEVIAENCSENFFYSVEFNKIMSLFMQKEIMRLTQEFLVRKKN